MLSEYSLSSVISSFRILSMLHILSCEPLLRILGHFFVKTGMGASVRFPGCIFSHLSSLFASCCFPLSNTPWTPLFTPMSQVFSFASVPCGSVRRELTEWMRTAQIPPHLCKLLCKWSGACLPSCESQLDCSPPTSLKTADLTWSSDKLPHFIGGSLGCHLTSLSQKLWMWSARLCVSSAC